MYLMDAGLKPRNHWFAADDVCREPPDTSYENLGMPYDE
jgi:hypothetical protein